jgi:hypothetical protein
MPACQWTGGFDKELSTGVLSDEGTYEAKLDTVTGKICEIEVQNGIAAVTYAA